MKSKDAPEHLKTNTGQRFITKGPTAYKLTIPHPSGGHVYKSVGFVRLGEKKGLKKAVALRNEIGLDLWGKFWPFVVNNYKSLARLPRTLEPRLANIKITNASSESYFVEYYVSDWDTFDPRTNRVKRHHRKYSTNKHGRLGAYIKARNELLNAHKKVLDILLFMGRVTIKSLG